MDGHPRATPPPPPPLFTPPAGVLTSLSQTTPVNLLPAPRPPRDRQAMSRLSFVIPVTAAVTAVLSTMATLAVTAGAHAPAVASARTPAMAGADTASPAATGHTLTGTFTLTDWVTSLTNGAGTASYKLDEMDAILGGKTEDCSEGLGGGYSDLAAGTDVSVLDGSGQLIATAVLTGGTLSSAGCAFNFSVVLPSSPFYQVQVANRGAIRYSEAQLTSDGWSLALSLGS
jgi:hypothetical protein